MGWPRPLSQPEANAYLTQRHSREILHIMRAPKEHPELFQDLFSLIRAARTSAGASFPSTCSHASQGFVCLFLFQDSFVSRSSGSCITPSIPFIKHGKTSGELSLLLIKLLR